MKRLCYPKETLLLMRVNIDTKGGTHRRNQHFQFQRAARLYNKKCHTCVWQSRIMTIGGEEVLTISQAAERLG